jgi:hypothetical protein
MANAILAVVSDAYFTSVFRDYYPDSGFHAYTYAYAYVGAYCYCDAYAYSNAYSDAELALGYRLAAAVGLDKSRQLWGFPGELLLCRSQGY